MSGSNLFDNFLKTPIKKRCPFRKSHQNFKKAPLKSLYTAYIFFCLAGIFVCTAMISMKANKIVFTFYPWISNINPTKTGVNKESVCFSLTFWSWYLKCTLTMEVPARFVTVLWCTSFWTGTPKQSTGLFHLGFQIWPFPFPKQKGHPVGCPFCFGGAGQIWTGEWEFCRLLPYHLATVPYEIRNA